VLRQFFLRPSPPGLTVRFPLQLQAIAAGFMHAIAASFTAGDCSRRLLQPVAAGDCCRRMLQVIAACYCCRRLLHAIAAGDCCMLLLQAIAACYCCKLSDASYCKLLLQANAAKFSPAEGKHAQLSRASRSCGCKKVLL
jgi:hypothetical protein